MNYALFFEGRFIGAYRSLAKAKLKAMQVCRENKEILNNYENLKRIERLLKKQKEMTSHEDLSFLKFVFYPGICTIEPFEME